MTAPAVLGKDRGICFRPDQDKPASRWQLQDAARRLLPRHRGLQRCHHAQAWGRSVQVWRGQHGAFFSGLQQCGSIWVCPVCAGKVAGGRAEELQRGIDYALSTGHGCMMVTLTFSHDRTDVLTDSMSGVSKALRALKSGRAYQALMRDFGIIGEVRALEVTHGQANGWHPHTHAITFTRCKLSAIERFRFECRLFVLWRAACDKAGIGTPLFGVGVHVRTAKDAADYVAKWGFATEVTHAHVKSAKAGGRTPWQLLADADAGDQRAAWLFREFAECFKGKRQLYYSKNLRQKLGLLEELTDQQLLDIEPDEKILVCEVDQDEWRMVVRFKARAVLLDAATQGIEFVRSLIDRLRGRTRAEIGTDGSTGRRRWLDMVNAGWAA